MNERTAVASAVSSSPNLNVAARKLGASRRTLQNRMRQFGMGYGTPGRRHIELPYAHRSHDVSDAVSIGAVVLGAGVVFWLIGRQKTVVQGGPRSRDIRGLDVLCRR